MTEEQQYNPVKLQASLQYDTKNH